MDLIGGYRDVYDPFPALAKINVDRNAAMNELWENLHHQGDVDTAAYASVPALVEAGELDLVSTIEICRHYDCNPDIPSTLVDAYMTAIAKAIQTVPADKENLQSYYALHASFHGQHDLALALHLMIVEDVLDG